MLLKEEDQNSLKTQAADIIATAGFYLVDLRVGNLGKRLLVKFIVAHEGHDITLDEVTALTHRLKDDPRFNELLPEDYHLEVSSPGIDYPLKDWRDFPRNIGRELRLFHHRPDLPSPLKGQLLAADQETLKVATQDRELLLPLSDLEYAKVVLKF